MKGACAACLQTLPNPHDSVCFLTCLLTGSLHKRGCLALPPSHYFRINLCWGHSMPIFPEQEGAKWDTQASWLQWRLPPVNTLIIHLSEVGINLDLKVCNCSNKHYIVEYSDFAFWEWRDTAGELAGLEGSHWPSPASPLLRQAGDLKALWDSWNHQRTVWLCTVITPLAQKVKARSKNHHNLWTYWKSYSSCLLCWSLGGNLKKRGSTKERQGIRQWDRTQKNCGIAAINRSHRTVRQHPLPG